MRVNHQTPTLPLNTAASLINLKARNARADISKADAAPAAAATPAKSFQVTQSPKCGPGMCGETASAPASPTADIDIPTNFSPAPKTPHELDGEGDTGNTVSEITTAPPTPPTGEISLAGFNKAWGTDNSQYDLDGNGTVNMDDMLSFINGLSQQLESNPIKPAQTPPVDNVETATPTLTTAAGPAATPTIGVEFVEPSTPPVQTPPAPETPTLAGILGAWGQNNTTFDLNGSGTVDMDDVLQFINSQSSAPSGIAGKQADESSSPDAASSLLSAKHPHRKAHLAKLTDSLIDRLGNAGFKHQPPTNIRQLVSSLNLSSQDSNHLLSNISKRYPDGLGVNVVG